MGAVVASSFSSTKAKKDDEEVDAAEKAINEATKHTKRADELAKEAAEFSLQSANEAMQARRMLDQHDIIAIENQTQSDVRKEEVARGLEAAAMPQPVLIMIPPKRLVRNLAYEKITRLDSRNAQFR